MSAPLPQPDPRPAAASGREAPRAKRVRFLDETLRNAQQSLWATRMKTSSMLPIAPVMDEAGFHEVCVHAGVSFESAAMYLFEDPWERMRLLRRQMPQTRLDVLVRSRVLWGWRPHPYDVQEVFLKTLLRNGVDSIKILDGLNDWRNLEWMARRAKELGFKVKVTLGFAVTPGYTDEYMAGKARELVELGVDGFVLGDSAGVLRPERARTALAAVRRAAASLEMHVHAHTITGLANECYREAMRAGADVLWTASRPVAYGKSVPATLDIARMAREEGVEPVLDEACQREIDDWFYWVAHEEGRPVPKNAPFDPAVYERYVGHQIPGGMFSNLQKQLSDLGLEGRLSEVLEEAGRVRAELGYPRMVTPFSQFVGVQAVLNVMEGKRYAKVPEAVRLYARGAYGRPIHPFDPDILDLLVEDAPLLDPREGMDVPALPRIRAEHGPFESDEDLLLFLFLNPAAYTSFRKSRKPIAWRPRRSPLTALIGELARRGDLASVELERGPLRLRLAGSGAASATAASGGANAALLGVGRE